MRLKTVGLGLVVLLVALLVGGITAVGWEVVLGPKARPVTDRTFEATPERLARGQYLAEGPAHCFFCHSEHDFSDPTYPIVQAKKGAGWDLPIPELGAVRAPNITSDVETGIGGWTDDEIARAIQEGVSRDGSALFPIMPYQEFAQLDAEDVASIVVYIRTLPAVRNVRARSEFVFPLSYLVNTMPQPLSAPRASHPSATPAERGAYLVNFAGCGGCHTPADDGTPLPGLAFAGGELFRDPGQNGKAVFSMNITPDPSGIQHYDEAMFIQTIRTGQLAGRTLNHIMPFESFRRMTDEDLTDIFAYLRTLTPVSHRISNTDPPALCPVCNREHGLGELNRKAQ